MAGRSPSPSPMAPVGAPTSSGGRQRRLAATLTVLVLAAGTVAMILLSRSSPPPQHSRPPSASLPWTIVDSPSPESQGVLNSVVCISSIACVAVGSSSPAGSSDPQHALVESWDGSSWSLTQRSTLATSGELRSVACTSHTSCVAVGSSSSTGNPSGDQAIAESWDGTSWSAVPVSTPGTASVLQAVACGSPRSCTAVGWSTTATGLPSALLESWDGATWSSVATPLPPGSVDSFLNSVACASPTSCVAVGSSSPTGDGDNPDSRTLIESWNGVSASVMPSPSIGTGGSVLVSVACPSQISCIAVGDFSPTNSPYRTNNQTLVETWSGSTWSVVSSAALPNAVQSLLASIACASAVSCVAVGSSTRVASEGPQPLAESWNGSTWSIVPNTTINGALDSVACTSPNSCMAVGRRSTSGHPRLQTLAERWRGSTENP